MFVRLSHAYDHKQREGQKAWESKGGWLEREKKKKEYYGEIIGLEPENFY